MKKVLLTLAITLLTTTSWAYDVCIEGVYYNLVSKAKIAEVTNETGSYDARSYSGCVNIPEKIIVDGETYSVTSVANNAFSGCATLTSVSLPISISKIGENAFYGCSNLTDFTIPNSITKIDKSVFEGCSSLSSIIIPNTVTSIDEYAFCRCSSLTSVDIPNSIKTIEGYSFAYCSSLTSITIPNSVTNIEGCAFSNCSKLSSVIIPNSVSSIFDRAFEYCSSLTSITIPNSVTEINNEVFQGCSSLASVNLPNSTTRIGSWSFQGCTNLTCITIPSSTKMIGMEAFKGCKNLENVYCYAFLTPAIGSDIFKDCYVEYSSLYVLDESLNLYRNTEPWSNFGSIKGMSERPYKVSYYLDDDLYKKQTYKQGDNIIPEENPTKEGHTFSGWSEIPELMPDHDVDVFGSFTVNDYKVTFISEGSIIKEETLAFGTTISIPESPEKVGHTFTGWNPTVDTTVPAHDVTYTAQFSVNQYTITFDTDGGTEIAPITQDYGTSITKPENPTKEGYTFTGWNAEIPEIMPAENLTVKATWTINAYKLTYILDGNIYKEYTLDYKSTITPEVEPTKEGYTFSGWSEIPSTMPAHDVEINGSFEVNTYKVSYFVENDLVHVDEVEFGKAFDLWTYVPEGDDITFNGWIGELYDTMPAHDITYRADITSGIAYIYNNAENISGIFTLGGRKVEKMDKGVYIVKMQNGNTRKVVNK